MIFTASMVATGGGNRVMLDTSLHGRLQDERLQAVVLDALAIGAIVTDRNARLLYGNEAARQILSAPSSALRLRAGRLHVAAPVAHEKLGAMIVAACAGGARSPGSAEYLLVAACEASAAPDLTLCVMPIAPSAGGHEPSAIVLVHIIERDCDLETEARCLFGLTNAEARFASALARGLSLNDAAGLYRVSLATARTHMKSIFRKTGVCRQSQVAALLRGVHIPIQRSRPSRMGGPAAALSA